MAPANPISARHPGSSIPAILFWELCRSVCTALAVTFWRGRWHGVRHVPASGAVLGIANHQSFLDPPVIGSCAGPREPDFVARAGLYKFPPLGWLLRQFWTVPVQEGGASDTAAVREMLARLKDDRLLIIFPEGSRTPDGEVKPFRRGAALLLGRARCPVVPMAVDGIFDAWPRSSRLPALVGPSVATAFGRPIEHAELMRHGTAAALERMQEEVDDLHRALRRLRERV